MPEQGENLTQCKPARKEPRRTTGSAVKRAERRAKAIELRKQGKKWDEIGAALGITRQSAQEMVGRVLDNINAYTVDQVNELREDQLEKVRTLTAVLWEPALQRDVQSLDRVVKLLEREAKLAGLDAPERHEVKAIPFEGVAEPELATRMANALIDRNLPELLSALAARGFTIVEPARPALEAACDK